MGKRVILTESELYRIISESIRSVLNEEEIKPNSTFPIPPGYDWMKWQKMVASKYGLPIETLKYDGSKLIYAPPKSATKKPKKPKEPKEPKKPKEVIRKPVGMSIDDYYNKIVLPNNEELAEKEKLYQDEEWRPVNNAGRYFNGDVDYGSFYEVSNKGRIRAINLDNAMKSYIYDGYDAPSRGAVQSHLNGFAEDGTPKNTCPNIKYIVANAWLEPHDQKKFKIIHLDGDYHNNSVENLMWVPKSKRKRNIG